MITNNVIPYFMTCRHTNWKMLYFCINMYEIFFKSNFNCKLLLAEEILAHFLEIQSGWTWFHWFLCDQAMNWEKINVPGWAKIDFILLRPAWKFWSSNFGLWKLLALSVSYQMILKKLLISSKVLWTDFNSRGKKVRLST